MKKRVYFDTSAVIKEFVPEVGSDLVDSVSNAAKEGRLQIITSAWSINEAIAVFDRLTRRPVDPLSRAEQQQIIATLVERFRDTYEHAAFRIAPIEHVIVASSRLLINELHISADDALHVYTGWVYDCDYFFIHDSKIVSRVKAAQPEGMKIVDLGNQQDRDAVREELGL